MKYIYFKDKISFFLSVDISCSNKSELTLQINKY